MNNHTWVIEKLECVEGDAKNTIHRVYWRLNGENNQKHTATLYGTVDLPEPKESDFVLFNNVSKDDVITWVQETMGSETVSKLYNTLDERLAIQSSPLDNFTKLPWAV